MGPVALAVTLLLLVRGERREALWLFATIAVGRLIVEGGKELVHRPRPPIADRLEHVTSWSFPSSHSAGTMMTALAIALVARGGWAGLLVAMLAAAHDRLDARRARRPLAERRARRLGVRARLGGRRVALRRADAIGMSRRERLEFRATRIDRDELGIGVERHRVAPRIVELRHQAEIGQARRAPAR